MNASIVVSDICSMCLPMRRANISTECETKVVCLLSAPAALRRHTGNVQTIVKIAAELSPSHHLGEITMCRPQSGELLRQASLKGATEVYMSGNGSAEARGAQQFSKTGNARERLQGQARLSGSNWIMKEKRQFPRSSLFYWRPRRDLNPCYRRERAFRGT
jgi:hypothetical protein